MLKNRIIPCLDVKNGRVVKGINFVDLKDAGDPVEQAKIYSDGGADEICFLDITASNENRDIIYDVVEKTSKIMDLRSKFFDFINLSERQLESFVNFLTSFRSRDLEKRSLNFSKIKSICLSLDENV